MRLRTWFISHGICYAAFLLFMALWLQRATADMPQDFWPVFTVEAVAGVLVAWLLTLAFWKIIWYLYPGAYLYHRSQSRFYAKKRARRHETEKHVHLDPADDPRPASLSATARI